MPSSGVFGLSGGASSKPAKSSKLLAPTEPFVIAFFVSARLSAICSRMLTGPALADTGLSSSKSLAGRQRGDFCGEGGGLIDFRLVCGRRVRPLLGVGLGGGLRAVLPLPAREDVLAAVLPGVRAVVRDGGACGMRDMAGGQRQSTYKAHVIRTPKSASIARQTRSSHNASELAIHRVQLKNIMSSIAHPTQVSSFFLVAIRSLPFNLPSKVLLVTVTR